MKQDKAETFEGATATERTYLEALQRLMDGVPTATALITLGQAGSIPLTKSNVALEAGRSRVPITGDGCRWPRVRDAVDAARAAAKSATLVQPNAAGRAERKASLQLETRVTELLGVNRVVKAERDAAYAKSAAAVLLLTELGRKPGDPARSPEERARARRAAEEHVATGV